MKNIIKYLGCLALGLLILNKVDFSVYAAEPSKVVRHVEYDEITDVNQLLQMGIEEYQKTPKVRNQSENEEITVKQLLSITEYDDGTIEKARREYEETAREIDYQKRQNQYDMDF